MNGIHLEHHSIWYKLINLSWLYGFDLSFIFTSLDFSSVYRAITDSLVYKILFLVCLFIAPFEIYRWIQYYFLDLHKYNKKDESEYETKEIRDSIN